MCEFKHCPCCGDSRIELNTDKSIFFRQVYKNESSNIGYKLRCFGCGMQTCWWHTKEQVIEAWDKRV